jgi:hypothetical protein
MKLFDLLPVRFFLSLIEECSGQQITDTSLTYLIGFSKDIVTKRIVTRWRLASHHSSIGGGQMGLLETKHLAGVVQW